MEGIPLLTDILEGHPVNLLALQNTAAESFGSQRHACRVHFLKVGRDKPSVPRSMIGKSLLIAFS